MYKIAYIEIDTHAEITENFMQTSALSSVFSVDYYLSSKIIKMIGNQKKNVFLASSKTIVEQLQNKHYDLVIIGTAHRYFNTFHKIIKQHKTAIIVHNLNFIRLSKMALLQKVFIDDFFYRMKLLLKEGLLSAPKIYKKSNFLLVLDENLVQENMRYLPIYFSKREEKMNAENQFCIVIPGEVSQKRRDYHWVFNTLENENPEIKTEVVFLGKAKGEEWERLQMLKNKTANKWNLVYFNEKIPQNEFDQYMDHASVLWCPLQVETSFFSNKEIYGKTKMSGNIGDAIKYQKWAFFPETYPNNFPFIILENREKGMNQFLEIPKENTNLFDDFKKEIVYPKLEMVLKNLIYQNSTVQ